MENRHRRERLLMKTKKNGFGKFRISNIVVLALVSVLMMGSSVVKGKETTVTVQNNDLKILKSEVTSKARFYPYTVDGVKMEVIAVKASDGTVRTALNTCQVCYDSGRGYYIQEADELVCQNCGNRFQIDKIEKIKNGCNPVPITADLKTDDGKYIIITESLLKRAKGLFVRWKK